jgi:hypothetical protein
MDHKSFQLVGPVALHGKEDLRFSNIVHGSSQTSSRNPHVDDELSDSEKSVGEESRIPSVTTLGVRMAKKVLKTPNNNSGVRRSTRVRYLYKDSHMMAL